MPLASSIIPGGAALFQRVFTRIGCEGRPPRFRVEFYPYSSLVLTIRRRQETIHVRFSDLLRRAPRAVLEGAAALPQSAADSLLFHKTLHVTPPPRRSGCTRPPHPRDSPQKKNQFPVSPRPRRILDRLAR